MRRQTASREVTVRTIVKGKNIDVPDNIRAYAERKMARLERILDDRSDALVELSVERHRSLSDSHIVEVTLVIDGRTLRTHAAAQNHRAGVDEVVDKLERRAVDHREKPRLRARPVEEKQLLRRIADGTAEPARERQIVKMKRFAIEPMFEEDAVAQMEELGHTFFVYVDAESERVHILYRRNDGDLGLIEPIVGGEYTKGRGRAANRSNGRH
ncbi:MAG: ribosome-associated translation inhibitor RaiA [Chloroflexi bacterium]|nr:MAG: ribosome-associated translation inhibitor RaiA [Chloroflexota bacterium]